MKWRCRDCGDVMPPRFEKSHRVLCKLAQALAQRSVDELLWDIQLDPPSMPPRTRA
jgi:hypothetical protein